MDPLIRNFAILAFFAERIVRCPNVAAFEFVIIIENTQQPVLKYILIWIRIRKNIKTQTDYTIAVIMLVKHTFDKTTWTVSGRESIPMGHFVDLYWTISFGNSHWLFGTDTDVPAERKKLMVAAKPTHVISVNGDSVTVKVTAGSFTTEGTFVLGKECEVTMEVTAKVDLMCLHLFGILFFHP